MNSKEAEILFQAGALEAPVIQKHASGDGWTVTLSGKHKLNPMLETARGKIRVFKRLDAAVGVLFGVGFGEITIVQTSKSLLT
ncbi:hypothetical protein [Methylotuvimicrobium buryatense]|uniref:Uncharacterized protein n=1 Tax=Methylotuvimicrobium buryatense TaxID=95641 RepID=A0A4P9UIY2_METBY|nr:hypothetical protein [Methylotuvimicrobium buryatense]QCW81008.1 hypothetical protein EQU24_01120 [Methylotuvimicrobium buryatense]